MKTMPTYEFKCKNCGNRMDVFATISELDKVKTSMLCCDRSMERVISVPSFFSRSPFPKDEYFEHVGPVPEKFRDSKHMKDVLDERGLTSALLENGDVK